MVLMKNKTVSILFIWILYATTYALTKNIPSIENLNGYLAFVGETGLDLACFVLAYITFRKKNNSERLFFSIICFSFLFSAISDGTYNAIFNILKLDSFSPRIESFFDVPFLLFLLLQTIAWFLIFMKSRKESTSKLKIASFAPFIFCGISILPAFFFLPSWKISITSAEGLYNAADTSFEVLSFLFASYALFLSRSRIYGLIASGYLIIIASDLIIRFSEVENLLFPGSPLETTWVLGLLFTTSGLYLSSKQNDLSIKSALGSPRNLKSQVGYWLFVSCVSAVTVLFIINIAFQNLNIKNLDNLPAVIIIFAILSALISSIIATTLTKPFKHMNKIIKAYEKHDYSIFEEEKHNIEIEEFTQLEDCLYKGLEAIKNEALKEKLYMESIQKYTESIKGPSSAISMLAEDIDELPEQKKQILKDATKKIIEATSSFNTNKAINKISNEIVIVEDNKNLTMAWSIDAANKGINLLVCNTPKEFKKIAQKISTDTLLYLDHDLKSDISGIDLAKWATDIGFYNIKIMSGKNIDIPDEYKNFYQFIDKRDVSF